MQDGVAEVLIVDDNRPNRVIIERHLQGGDYILYSACDGEEALRLLKAQPDIFDVILLDLMMPVMDDMTLLNHIKTSDSLAHIPVIIQSALSAPSDLRKAVQAGAFYYLIKPFRKYELLAIVQTAVQDMVLYRQHQQALSETKKACGLLVSATFHFKTPAEGLALAAHLSENYAKPKKVITGIQELFLNAVEHGNLAITYDEKTILNDTYQLQNEIARRLALPEYKDRKVIVEFTRNNDSLVLTITDEGQGFEWLQYMEVAPERITHNHGRGIAMANLLAFDSLTYIGKANIVKAVISID